MKAALVAELLLPLPLPLPRFFVADAVVAASVSCFARALPVLVDVAEPARSVVAVDGSARLLEPEQHWLLLGRIVAALDELPLRELCRSDASFVVVRVPSLVSSTIPPSLSTGVRGATEAEGGSIEHALQSETWYTGVRASAISRPTTGLSLRQIDL